ncbi:hypothetical protein D9M68_837900 [compost metagenome]
MILRHCSPKRQVNRNGLPAVRRAASANQNWSRQHQLAAVGGSDGAEWVVHAVQAIAALVGDRDNERTLPLHHFPLDAQGDPAHGGVRQGFLPAQDGLSKVSPVDALGGSAVGLQAFGRRGGVGLIWLLRCEAIGACY